MNGQQAAVTDQQWALSFDQKRPPHPPAVPEPPQVPQSLEPMLTSQIGQIMLEANLGEAAVLGRAEVVGS